MADFFTNRLQLIPSPALLKAMLINGARRTSTSYDYNKQTPMNLEGWGLINIRNSLPGDLTNNATAPTNTLFFLDQSTTNALATGDSETFGVSVSTNATGDSLVQWRKGRLPAYATTAAE